MPKPSIYLDYNASAPLLDEAREAILELEKQQREAEEKQGREISEITARQRAEAQVVEQQERQRAETARISTEEEIAVAEENRGYAKMTELGVGEITQYRAFIGGLHR